MRVAVLTSEVAHLPSDERKRCFKEFKTQKDLEEAVVFGSEPWEVHQLSHHYGQMQRQRYQDFVCGFLEFYDRHVRDDKAIQNDPVGHTVYFVWQGNEVTMYITPKARTGTYKISLTPPGMVSGDPPKPPAPPPPSSF